MPMTLITGPANAGKAQVVMDAVRRHLAHGEEPLLIVPTRADAEHYLRELAGEEAALGVRVERFAGLIGEAVRRAGLDRAGARRASRARRVIEALAARAGGRAGISASVGFVRALAELFAELRVRRVTPARFERALALARDGAPADGARRAPRGSSSGGCSPSTARRSSGSGAWTSEQRAVARAGRAARAARAVGPHAGAVVRLRRPHHRCSWTRSRRSDGVVDAAVTVSLAYEPGRVAFAGRAASFQALAPLADEHRELPARAELLRAARARRAQPPRALAVRAGEAARVDAGAAVTLLEGGGERAELELVAGEIDALLGGRHRAARRSRCSCAPAPPTLDLLEEVLTAAAHPVRRSQRRMPIRRHRDRRGADRPAALRAGPAGAPPDAGVAGEGAADGGGTLADLLAWLRAPGLLLRARDRRGLPADWLEISARRAGALTRRAGARAVGAAQLAAGDDRPLRRGAGARRRRAVRARRARAAVAVLRSPARAPRRCSRATELDERSRAVRRSAGAGGAARARPPRRRAGARGRARELAARPGAARDSGRRPRGPRAGRRGGGARPAGAARAQGAGAVRVRPAGGRLPGTRAGPQPILAEEERRRLAETSGLRLGEHEDVLAAERYLLYAAVSRPQERLFLSWHVADDDGETASRSLFVDDVCDLFDRGPRASGVVRRPLGAVDGIASRSPDRAQRAARAPETERCATSGCWPSCASACGRRRRSRSGSAVPVSWFVERMLRPDAFDPDPEPLARGGLAHAALKDTLEGLRRETGSARLHARQPRPRARAAGRRRLSANEADRPLSVAPERRAAVRRRLQADLERYLAYAAACASAPLRGRCATRGRARAARSGARLRRSRRRAAGVRARRRRRCCAGASTASTSAAQARRSCTTTRAAARPPARGGSGMATCRWRCTCAPSRGCWARPSSAASTSR